MFFFLLQIWKYECTVLHLGKSLGNILHWQPDLMTYSAPQNASYRSTFLGLVFFLAASSIGKTLANCSRVISLGYFFLFICFFVFVKPYAGILQEKRDFEQALRTGYHFGLMLYCTRLALRCGGRVVKL